MSDYRELPQILGVDSSLLENLDREMSKRVGSTGVMQRVAEENDKVINDTLNLLNSNLRSAAHVRSVLRQAVLRHEKELLDFLSAIEGQDEFQKAINLAKKISRVNNGYFLKKELAEEILKKRPPENVLKYLGVATVEEALVQHDVAEIFSALRFVETDEWMHQTFDIVYSSFTPTDFEERAIEIRVLGPEWREVAKKFIAKKHHNVSHLKEFGVIFINPVREQIPGKFLRDFALLLHYSHEIEFYSKLFRRYSTGADFAEKLKALLRGDVPEIYRLEPGEWLIVQRYLAKENPLDPRLYLPRVSPESLHWRRGESDLALFNNMPEAKLNLGFWADLNWVGNIFTDVDGSADSGEVVSFDLEDNAMSLAAFMEGKERQYFSYHQREAMWAEIFSQYVGGDENMERLLLDNFDKGVIKF
jgi:hypothetical protein